MQVSYYQIFITRHLYTTTYFKILICRIDIWYANTQININKEIIGKK